MNSMHCLVAGLEFRLHYSARTNRERRLRQAIENRMFELQFSPPCVSIHNLSIKSNACTVHGKTLDLSTELTR